MFIQYPIVIKINSSLQLCSNKANNIMCSVSYHYVFTVVMYSYVIEFFLFGVRLIRPTAITVYKVRILNKDRLQMFGKVLI